MCHEWCCCCAIIVGPRLLVRNNDAKRIWSDSENGILLVQSAQSDQNDCWYKVGLLTRIDLLTYYMTTRHCPLVLTSVRIRILQTCTSSLTWPMGAILTFLNSVASISGNTKFLHPHHCLQYRCNLPYKHGIEVPISGGSSQILSTTSDHTKPCPNSRHSDSLRWECVS